MKNTAEFNYVFWGQGQRTTSKKIEPTKLIKPADFNGDGHAWEFRLVQPGACGHYATLLAGYSARQRMAILFPILVHEHRVYWGDNLFPHPSTPNATKIKRVWQCGDHGSETHTERDYAYHPRREAWSLTRERMRACEILRPRPYRGG